MPIYTICLLFFHAVAGDVQPHACAADSTSTSLNQKLEEGEHEEGDAEGEYEDGEDPDVISRGDSYFNTRLSAPNVWEIDVSPKTIDKAGALFNEIDLSHLPVSAGSSATTKAVKTVSGAAYFVYQNPFGAISDLQWISVDDQSTYDAFHQIFKELRIPQRFGHLVSDSDKQLNALGV